MSTETISNLILAFCFGFVIAIFITPIFVYLKKIMYDTSTCQVLTK